MMDATHFLIDGSIGGSPGTMSSAGYSFETGAGFNMIRHSTLLPDCESHVDLKATATLLIYANSRPIDLAESVWLAVRFTNELYRVTFVVAERLVVELVIGTKLLNGHVLAII